MRKRLFTLAVVLASLPTIAHAATLTTDFGLVQNTGVLLCDVINVGKKPLDITIERLDAAGAIKQTATVSVAVGERSTITEVANGNIGRYCRFSFAGPGKNVRASMCIAPPQTASCAVVNSAR